MNYGAQQYRVTSILCDAILSNLLIDHGRTSIHHCTSFSVSTSTMHQQCYTLLAAQTSFTNAHRLRLHCLQFLTLIQGTCSTETRDE